MFNKVSHISIAMILVVSTLGLTINKHYCKDKLYDSGIFSEARNCCVEESIHEGPVDVKHHYKRSQYQICDVHNHKMNDCRDETINVGHVDNFVVSSFHIDFNALSSIYLSLSVPFFSGLFNLSDTFFIIMPERYVSPHGIHQVVLSFLSAYLL